VQTLEDIAPYLAAAALVAAAILALLLALQWRAVRRLRRAQVVILGSHDERDIVEHVQTLDSRVRNLREAVERLTDELDEHRRHLDEALTNRAIVRYDAFRDAGGEQSASLALLDNHRSGLVVTTIAARDFARLYVKHLDHGVADRELSPEEQRAVEAAVPTPLPAPAGPAGGAGAAGRPSTPSDPAEEAGP
jgi:Protein of unknown function (DUF4446)